MDFIFALQQEIKNQLGESKAAHINVAVLPSIIMDFKKMLESTSGQVSEDYHLEDGSLNITLRGSDKQVTQALVNGKRIF